MEMICKLFAVVFLSVVLYSIQAKAQGGDGEVMSCLQKLTPCQPYIHTLNPPPPPSCCGPVKEIVEKEAPSKKKIKTKNTTCLCTLLDNPAILQQRNITKDNVLDLSKACSVNPDVSKCTIIASSSPLRTASPGSASAGGSSVQAVSFIGLVFASAFASL
ncbi:unnamed protein product, partial [Thlaspi arvense]